MNNAELFSSYTHLCFFNFTAKLEALNNKPTTSGIVFSDKGKTTKSKTAKQGDGKTENVQLQKLSVQTLTNENANKDQPMASKSESSQPIEGKASDGQEPMTSKAESLEPIKGKANDSHAPVQSKATDSQLSNDKNDAKTAEAAKEAPFPSEVPAEVQREVETAKMLPDVQDKAEGEALKTSIEDVLPSNATKVEDEVNEGVAQSVPEASNNGEKSPSLPLECVGSKTEQEANAIAKEIKVQADAIREVEPVSTNDSPSIEESDVTKEIEADVINKIQSDVSNKVELDVICKPAIAAKPSQVSITFEVSVEANLTTAGEEDEGKSTIVEAVNLSEQSVATETATSSTEVVWDTGHNDVTDIHINADVSVGAENDGHLDEVNIVPSWDGSKISEKTGMAKDVVEDSQNGHDIATECQESTDLQSESEVTTQRQEVSDVEQAEVDTACVDESLSQPLLPEVGEFAHVGVTTLVHQEDIPILAQDTSNDVTIHEDDEQRENVVDDE